MIDLHIHSAASDGSVNPKDLAALGKKQGLTLMALTDHDTIKGNEEAGIASNQEGIHFIPGIEIEINGANEGVPGEFHLLGLGINRPDHAFLDAIALLIRQREERNREILKRMEEFDIRASYEEIEALSGGHSVGRPHFASFLVKRRIVKNQEQAFLRYLGKGRPFYVPKAGLDFDHAVSLVQNAGGIAILAHPMSLYVAWGRLPDLIKNLKNRGLDGLEAWHPAARVRDCRRLEDLARTLNLYISAGSDFHGGFRPDRKLGITAGGKKIEASMLDPSLIERLKSSEP